ncbi:DmsC/YnfH family molybdoenzyme membrane anchor subunit [Pseudoruegeria sp. SK021]|uniref:dimethyl sulfoxide reductase anchor subunit family protein n=1 Tax=Pseudoruegeria sp. SK021 TaxID=1933035 RepID=UPI000A25EF04|nr:DmsC/YnfH family molybdoenzyme membrane anchor subunit [Pseudoruegeria sp. SK021]OSP54357.1 dibenzothiophene desulfurase [Pseudoruegeria sp. SK021]
MHPSPSVIVFTVLSGLGFGLLIWLGVGFPQVTGWSAFGMFALAYLLAVGGLAASTFHLGNPQRALLAFTQWQTSWLSREAIASVLTLVLMAVFGFALVFFGTRLYGLGFLGSFCALLTVLTTSMIYTQLKTVPRWHQPGTPILFVALALAGGALLTGVTVAALWFLLVAGGVQIMVWTIGDSLYRESKTSLATATGLDGSGDIRQMSPPHTGSNYLLTEMVYVVGRKHAQLLRIASIITMSGLPVLLLLIGGSGGFAWGLAVVSHVAGVGMSRWLFFAEAEHVARHYYDQR